MSRIKVFAFGAVFFLIAALLFIFMCLPGVPDAVGGITPVGLRQWTLSALTIGIILFSGAYHLLLMAQHKNRLHLFFGVTCLATVTRFLFEKGSVLFSIYPPLANVEPRFITVPMLLLQAFFGCGFFIMVFRNELYRNTPGGVLYFISFAVLQIVGTGFSFFLHDVLFMPGLAANLFMMMTQAFMLSQTYVAALKHEQEAVLHSEMLEQLNNQKDNFLTNMSHEMKTPLAVINGYLELCLDAEKQKPAPDKKAIENMTKALAEGNRAAIMTGQLLDIGCIESNSMVWHLARVNIKKLITEVQDRYFAMLNKNHNTLRLDISDGLPDVYADEEQISRVLVNLIQNAVKHTRHGTIIASAKETYGFVRISVQDSGVGIPAEQMPHLFERFAVGEKSTGTGLGLYICKQTIDAHGGSIGIASEPSKGTTVHFTLPIYTQKKEREVDE